MPSQAPPPSSPPGVPSNGGGKYVIVAVLLLGAIGGTVAWKMSQKPVEQQVVLDAGSPREVASGRDLDEEIPLPPSLPEAGPEEPEPIKKASAPVNQCDAKKCVGSSGQELEGALAQRVRQSHRCYDNALAQDPTLTGKITVAVRVGSNGQACSASIASNDMGSSQVASCVTGYFRGVNFPAPKGGCVDVNIPINFVPRQ